MKIPGCDAEQEYGEYLDYLYSLTGRHYSDHPAPDDLVQDTLCVFLLKRRRGEEVEHPKGFLSAVLKRRYYAWLREKYRAELVEYTDGAPVAANDPLEETQELAEKAEEYEDVRRELGRLVRIYREVTVRHYVHGHTVERIAADLGLARGTVLSRLSTARGQIKEGLENMEKYAKISYEPKSATIGIWGSAGLGSEPFSLLRSDIETNILYLAYEVPVSVRGIADTMGMPSAYLEPIIEGLIAGELMGRTAGGLVYTRCFLQRYREAFGNIPLQEKLAGACAEEVWAAAWRHFAPLTERAAFAGMTEKQKGTMLLFGLHQALSEVIRNTKPDRKAPSPELPERPNGGRWLATVTVHDHAEKRDIPYEGSGPVVVGYSARGDGVKDCQMFDCQSLFGDAHWAYGRLKYRGTLTSILRFYASFLPCDVKTDNELLYELIPDFVELGILRRDETGEARLDVPALPFSEVTGYWNPAIDALERELAELLGDRLRELWAGTVNRVPKHVDGAPHYRHEGALRAYTMAQLAAIVKQGLLPFPVVIGKTPLIFVAYRERTAK